jgi:hypothetical protein
LAKVDALFLRTFHVLHGQATESPLPIYSVGMNEANFLWMLLVVSTAVVNLISMLVNLRRKPPMSEELYKNYLPKDDHAAMCEAIKTRVDARDNHNTETHVEIFNLIRAEREWATTQIEQNQKAVQADFKVLERGLGRVEGILKNNSEG